MAKIELGDTVTDAITGFTGVATGYVTYITGCNQFCVTPKAKDSVTKDSIWFDEQRLTKNTKAKRVKLDNTNAGFGDAPPAY